MPTTNNANVSDTSAQAGLYRVEGLSSVCSVISIASVSGVVFVCFSLAATKLRLSISRDQNTQCSESRHLNRHFPALLQYGIVECVAHAKANDAGLLA